LPSTLVLLAPLPKVTPAQALLGRTQTAQQPCSLANGWPVGDLQQLSPGGSSISRGAVGVCWVQGEVPGSSPRSQSRCPAPPPAHYAGWTLPSLGHGTAPPNAPSTRQPGDRDVPRASWQSPLTGHWPWLQHSPGQQWL